MKKVSAPLKADLFLPKSGTQRVICYFTELIVSQDKTETQNLGIGVFLDSHAILHTFVELSLLSWLKKLRRRPSVKELIILEGEFDCLKWEPTGRWGRYFFDRLGVAARTKLECFLVRALRRSGILQKPNWIEKSSRRPRLPIVIWLLFRLASSDNGLAISSKELSKLIANRSDLPSWILDKLAPDSCERPQREYCAAIATIRKTRESRFKQAGGEESEFAQREIELAIKFPMISAMLGQGVFDSEMVSKHAQKFHKLKRLSIFPELTNYTLMHRERLPRFLPEDLRDDRFSMEALSLFACTPYKLVHNDDLEKARSFEIDLLPRSHDDKMALMFEMIEAKHPLLDDCEPTFPLSINLTLPNSLRI